MLKCEDCGKDIKGKPVVVNGILFYDFKCYYAEEIQKLGKVANHLYKVSKDYDYTDG